MSAAEGLLDPQEEDFAPTAAECIAFVSDNQTHGFVESLMSQIL